MKKLFFLTIVFCSLTKKSSAAHDEGMEEMEHCNSVMATLYSVDHRGGDYFRSTAAYKVAGSLLQNPEYDYREKTKAILSIYEKMILHEAAYFVNQSQDDTPELIDLSSHINGNLCSGPDCACKDFFNALSDREKENIRYVSTKYLVDFMVDYPDDQALSRFVLTETMRRSPIVKGMRVAGCAALYGLAAYGAYSLLRK